MKLLLRLVALAAVRGACAKDSTPPGPPPHGPPDHSAVDSIVVDMSQFPQWDFGSCGNACCAVDIPLNLAPQAVYDAVAWYLQSGGDVESGTYSHLESSKDDLRDKGGEWKFIARGVYATSGGEVSYPARLMFQIRERSGATSVLRAFSMSDLPGSFDDAMGKRYKSLESVVLGSGLDAHGVHGGAMDACNLHILHGCGSPGGTWHIPGVRQFVPLSSGIGRTASLGTSTCGLDGGVEDCHRTDLGSCGNACCALEVGVHAPTEAVYNSLKAFLQWGGDENAFAYVPGDMPNNEHPPDDLRFTELTAMAEWKRIVQGKHTTSGRGYVDTLNFNVREDANASASVLRLFSISDYHPAVGDLGQNYKSLSFIIRAIGMDPSVASVLYGCGDPGHEKHVRAGRAALSAAALLQTR